MLGNNIYELRKANKMNQEQLASILNVSRQAVSKWERDESTPDLEKLTALSKVFDVTVDELLNDSYDVSSYKVPQTSLFANIDESVIKMAMIGIALIAAMTSLYTIFNITKFVNFVDAFPLAEITMKGFLSTFIGDVNVLLGFSFVCEVFVLAGAAVILYLYLNNQVSVKVKYGVMIYGILVVLINHTLIGLVYIILGFILKEKECKINIKHVALISATSLLVCILSWFVFSAMTTIKAPNEAIQNDFDMIHEMDFFTE